MEVTGGWGGTGKPGRREGPAKPEDRGEGFVGQEDVLHAAPQDKVWAGNSTMGESAEQALSGAFLGLSLPGALQKGSVWKSLVPPRVAV